MPQAEGALSGPFDKPLGRQADPAGGKVYEKGSACPRSVSIYIPTQLHSTFGTRAKSWNARDLASIRVCHKCTTPAGPRGIYGTIRIELRHSLRGYSAQFSSILDAFQPGPRGCTG